MQNSHTHMPFYIQGCPPSPHVPGNEAHREFKFAEDSSLLESRRGYRLSLQAPAWDRGLGPNPVLTVSVMGLLLNFEQ